MVAADVEVAAEVQVTPPVSWDAWAAGAVSFCLSSLCCFRIRAGWFQTVQVGETPCSASSVPSWPLPIQLSFTLPPTPFLALCRTGLQHCCSTGLWCELICTASAAIVSFLLEPRQGTPVARSAVLHQGRCPRSWEEGASSASIRRPCLKTKNEFDKPNGYGKIM